MSKALIVVDVQNDFCEGGSLGVSRSSEIFPIINKIREDPMFNSVFVTMDWHPENHVSFARTHNQEPFTTKVINGKEQVIWPDHCVQNSYGAQINKQFNQKESDIVIKKGLVQEEQYSAFGTKANPSDLEAKLRERKVQEIVIVGLALDYCVGNTALDAREAGFKVTIVQEGTKPVAKETGDQMVEQFAKNDIRYISVSDLSK